jgi:hypothetical protein
MRIEAFKYQTQVTAPKVVAAGVLADLRRGMTLLGSRHSLMSSNAMINLC